MWYCFSGAEWQLWAVMSSPSKADGREVISQAGPEALAGLFRPWVNTLLELDVSKLILEAGLHGFVFQLGHVEMAMYCDDVWT